MCAASVAATTPVGGQVDRAGISIDGGLTVATLHGDSVRRRRRGASDGFAESVTRFDQR